MAYVCNQLQIVDGLQTCVLWVEQVSFTDFFAITSTQALTLGLGFATVIIIGGIFNKLSQIGDKSHD